MDTKTTDQMMDREQMTLPCGTSLDQDHVLRCDLHIEIMPSPASSKHDKIVKWLAVARIGQPDGYHTAIVRIAPTRDQAIEALKNRLVAALVESEAAVKAQELELAAISAVVIRCRDEG